MDDNSLEFQPFDNEDALMNVEAGALSLSKRGARRLIQRAFVLVGRDRQVRQHIREVRLLVLWAIENWKLTWTLEIDRGKLHFERRPAKRPDVTLSWESAEEFFAQIENGALAQGSPATVGSSESRRAVEQVFKAFCSELRGLLHNPVDEDGESLL